MCGRFTLFANYNEIIERFDIQAAISEELYHPNYNIAPSHSVLSVINDSQKNRLGYLRWGLIPSWAKDEKIGFKLINARSETLLEKPSFGDAFKKRRCLIIADSFYEWKRNDDQTKKPMRIKLKSSHLFAMAGLWERWKSPEGKVIYTCTVITTSGNEVMKDIHERMPVILKPEDEKIWLNREITDFDPLHPLLKPYPSDMMEAYEVSHLVNSPKNNSPNLLQPLC
jgi:putative SOS response-associated peptidase YedK